MGYSTILLTLGLLVSGVCIPLILTFQNHQLLDGSDQPHYFHQPLLQAIMIFVGEILCILMIRVLTKSPSFLDPSVLGSLQPHQSLDSATDSQQEWSSPPIQRTSVCAWSSFYFIFPSICDISAILLANIGLIYSTPSVFQMMRSSITGLSAISGCLFLSRRILRHELPAILVMFIGTGMILWSSALSSEEGWLGPLLLLGSQIFVTIQYVLEEYLMKKYQLDPIRAMGTEAVFGGLLVALGVLLASLLVHDPESTVGQILDIKAGYADLIQHPALWQSAIALSLIVATFNFFGLAFGPSMGISGGSSVDMTRIALIWIVAIHFGWDNFSWLELVGFVMLGLGVFVFNGVFSSVLKRQRGEPSETSPLLA
ncbi:hypothetical protein F4703DRAFT_1889905 [Phycomyces blakesleeanus]